MTRVEESALAERFAPTLVFHPSENYFPVNPLFPIEDRPTIQADPESLVSILGTAQSRRKNYQELTLDQKAELATVYYRAYPARRGSDAVVVIEYWMYYVQDNYRVRGNILPLWTDGSHPNDLEHIHLVLRATDGADYSLAEVYASSHEGTIPANRYRPSANAFPERVRFLVELGSHALAPDIDGDGVFTPGRDGSSGYKTLWGIRDRGITWARYRPGYMDTRSEASATVFAYPTHGLNDPDQPLAYRLVPVDALRADFAGLGLTDAQREALFETDRHWFRRVFGGDNGSSEKLLVPPRVDLRNESIGIDDYAATERGFLLGATFNLDEPGFLLGARYAYMHGIQFLPDLMFEADGVLTKRTPGYLSTQLLLTYPIDGTTKLMGGRALVTDSIRFERRQWDWIAAIEIRFGDVRLWAASRSVGPIVPSAKEFRLSYFF